MREVSKAVVQAFLKGESKKVGNTRTDGTDLFLHGHSIAFKFEGTVQVWMAGWHTSTTRERLNCLFSFLSSFGYEPCIKGVFQRNFVTYFQFTDGTSTPAGDDFFEAGRKRQEKVA